MCLIQKTEIDVVPMPGLVWRCGFTSQKVNEDLVHKVCLLAVAHLANICATKEKEDGLWNCLLLKNTTSQTLWVTVEFGFLSFKK